MGVRSPRLMIDHLSDATEGKQRDSPTEKARPPCLPGRHAITISYLRLTPGTVCGPPGYLSRFAPPQAGNPGFAARPDVKLPRICKNHLGRARPLNV